MADGLVQSLGLGRSASHNQIDLDDYLYLVYDYPSKHVPYVSYLGTDIDLSIYIYKYDRLRTQNTTFQLNQFTFFAISVRAT